MLQMQEVVDFMKPLIMVSYEGSEIMANESLTLIKGSVGSGKSRLCLNLVRGLLGKEDDLGFTYETCPDDRYVYYFSTEMSNYHLQKRYLSLIQDLSQDEKDKFLCFNFYEEDKLDDITTTFKQNRPYAVIIDQVADFATGINDEKESNLLIKKIAQAARDNDAGIALVLHQNEGSSSNSKSRGHLGSGLEQKCISSIAINKSGQQFKIQSTKIREGSTFNVHCKYNPLTGRLIKANAPTKTFTQLTFPCESSELKDQIMKLEDCSESLADKRIKFYFKEEMTTRVKNGRSFTYSLNTKQND